MHEFRHRLEPTRLKRQDGRLADMQPGGLPVSMHHMKLFSTACSSVEGAMQTVYMYGPGKATKAAYLFYVSLPVGRQGAWEPLT